MAITTLAVTAFVVSAASAAYQVIQAKKMQEKADRSAEARRGFELPIEGQAADLALVYGRAMIGGTRTWHAVQGSFRYVAPNADKSFLTGTAARAAYVQTYTRYPTTSGLINDLLNKVTANQAIPATEGGYLNQSINGVKNEFLFFQQALCVGPINSVQDVIIDQGRYIDDPALGSYGYAADVKHAQIKGALRIDCHLGETAVADAIAAANFGERGNAVFDGMAYASAVVRIDRNSPQFNAVPALQFLIEGRKVRTVQGGELSTLRTYSNNPAWCLLDYLLDEEVGKGVPEDEIDLVSFENAAALFGRIVQTNVAVGGKFWQPTDNARKITHRDIPLYECNIVIDPSKPVRENIEAILATAGDTRLIWSGGQYRLSAQYPASNAEIDVDEFIDDDDLVMDQDIDISWPSASERLNNCTIRFHNEHEGFKEDTVSWPPKQTESYWKGIGGFRYGLPNGSWSDDKEGDRLLNNYGVWDTDASDIVLDYLFKVEPEQAGSYTVTYTGDDSMSFTIWEANPDGSTIVMAATGNRPSSGGGWNHGVSTTTASLGGATTKFYKVTVNAHDNGTHDEKSMKGVAIKVDNSSTVLWSTREPSYSAFLQVVYNSAVYDEMFAEDGNNALEASIYADGITDPYHALAKTEEMVRTSRSAFTIAFKYRIKSKYLEPGDFVQLQSTTLGVGFGSNPLFIRVNSVKVDPNGECEVSGTRFDWTQLAWNVKDDQYLTPRSIYDSQVGLVSNLKYSPPIDTNVPSSGILTWTGAAGMDVAGYAVYVFSPLTDAYDSSGQPVFREIGRTSAAETRFIIPPQEVASLFFGVRTVALSGRLSDMVILNVETGQDLYHNWLNQVGITLSDYGFTRRSTDLALVPEQITAKANTIGYTSPQFAWYIDNELQPSTTDTLVIPAFSNTKMKIIEVRVNELGGTAVKRGVTSIIYLDNTGNVPMLQVKADRTAIHLDETTGLPNPSAQTTVFTAIKNNLDDDFPITWTVFDMLGVAVDPSTHLSATSGDTVSMTAAQWLDAKGVVGDGVRVTATGRTTEGTPISATFTLIGKTGDLGESIITVVLSRTSAHVPTDSDGLNPNFRSTGTDINVYENSTALAYSASAPGPGQWTVVADGGGIVTPGTLQASGTTATYGDITAMTSDGGRITFTITGKKANGTEFTAVATEEFLKYRGAVIDINPPGPPGFPGTPLTYTTVVMPDGATKTTAKLTWTAPTESATDLNFYEVGIRVHGAPDYIFSQTSVLSYEWAITPGTHYDYTLRAVDKSTNKSIYIELLDQAAPGDTSIPAAPAPVAVVSSVRSAFLKWNNAMDADITKVKVYGVADSTTQPAEALASVNAVPGQPGGFTYTGLQPGEQWRFWLTSVDSSGNESPPTAAMGPIASSNLVQDDFVADSISADVLKSNSSIPASLVVGSTGFSLGDSADKLITQGPATYVDPGKILISGATVLSDWRNGSDLTKIEGGSIAANTVTANKLSIGSRGVDITGIQFSSSVDGNGNPTGNISWTAGTISYIDDSGAPVTQSVAAGSVVWSSGILYIYWTKGGSVLQSSTSMGTVYGSNKITLASYSSGVGLIASYGKTVINGSDIAAGTIKGDRLIGNSVTATQIDTRNLTIKDASGNIIFGAGTALNYVNVTGGPPANATNGATFGTNVFGNINLSNISTYIAAGAIGTAYIQDAAITNAKISDLSADKINTGSLNAAFITAGTITASKIVGGAISTMLGYENASPATYPAGTGNGGDHLSFGYMSEGGKVLLTTYGDIGTTGSNAAGAIVKIYCDDIQIGVGNIYCPGSWGGVGVGIPVHHQPSAGYHVYRVEYRQPTGGGSSGGYQINRTNVVITELKR